MKNQVFSKKKRNHIRAAMVFLVGDVLWKNLRLFFRFGGILDPRVLCGQLLRAFISIQCSPMSSSASGPLARAAKRRRGVNPMMAGMNPFLASMFGPAFALLVPTRADIVLMDR